MTKKIFCIGGAAVDRKLQTNQPLTHNTSNPASTSAHFGGVARNVAENLANWASNIYLHTVVGEDDDGVQMLSSIKQKGVDITHSIILKGARTANYYAVLDHKGELYLSLADMAVFDQVPVSRFTQGFNVWDADSTLFMDTNLNEEILQTAITMANDKNIRLCIDPVSAIKAKKLLGHLNGIYLLKPNPLEAGVLANMTIETIDDALRAGQILQKKGVENSVITLGKAGYVITNKEMNEYVAIEAIHDVMNVNGAGDAFMAGVIYGIQQAFPLTEACLWGAAAAAFTVSSPDTVAANLTLSQLQSFIHNQKLITEEQHASIF